jgi:hypothetical protein
VSRIELDAADRGSVERAREALAVLERAGSGKVTHVELRKLFGDALGQARILLRVIDGGAS